MKTKLMRLGLFIAALAVVPVCCLAATKKQSAIQGGTSVRAKVAATGVFSQECYDTYYGCMDQFCIMDNEDGGSCACSDKNAEYEKRLLKVKEILVEAERIKTEEVERVQAGANADIIFNGTREYGKDGDVVKVTDKKNKKKDLLAMWDDASSDEDEDEDEFVDEQDSLAGKTGDAV